MDNNLYGWWGKYEIQNEKPVKVWVGPMTEKEMRESYGEYRHNFSETDPKEFEAHVKRTIVDPIAPETSLEWFIVEQDSFIAGCSYGKPRDGHPEGAVVNHILEVLRNVDKYSPYSVDSVGRISVERMCLRLLALLHDSFKYQVDQTMPKVGANHHGTFARRFAEGIPGFPSDLLDLLELHDEAYNAWKKYMKGETQTATIRNANMMEGEERARRLMYRLGDRLELYLTFYRCDNETGDKVQDGYSWFKDLVAKDTERSLSHKHVRDQEDAIRDELIDAIDVVLRRHGLENNRLRFLGWDGDGSFVKQYYTRGR